MSLRKKTLGKMSKVEPSRSSQQEEGVEVVRDIYDDTTRLLEKYGETLKWGESVLHVQEVKFLHRSGGAR